MSRLPSVYAGHQKSSLHHLSLEAVADAVAAAIVAATEPVGNSAVGGLGGPTSRKARAVHLVGYSLGARLALAVAARHPQLASRLVLISGSPGLEGEPVGLQLMPGRYRAYRLPFAAD